MLRLRWKRGDRIFFSSEGVANSHLCIYFSTLLSHHFTYISFVFAFGLDTFFFSYDHVLLSLQKIVIEHLLCRAPVSPRERHTYRKGVGEGEGRKRERFRDSEKRSPGPGPRSFQGHKQTVG